MGTSFELLHPPVSLLAFVDGWHNKIHLSTSIEGSPLAPWLLALPSPVEQRLQQHIIQSNWSRSLQWTLWVLHEHSMIRNLYRKVRRNVVCLSWWDWAGDSRWVLRQWCYPRTVSSRSVQEKCVPFTSEVGIWSWEWQRWQHSTCKLRKVTSVLVSSSVSPYTKMYARIGIAQYCVSNQVANKRRIPQLLVSGDKGGCHIALQRQRCWGSSDFQI